MSSNRDQIRQIFLKAIELPFEEQAAYIQQQCSSNPALRDEVTRLVAHHSKSTLIPRGGAPKSRETAADSDLKRSADTNIVEFPGKAPNRRSAARLTSGWTRQVGRGKLQLLLLALGSLVVFSLLSWYLDRSIGRFIRDSVQASLKVLLDEERFSVENWLDAEFRIGRIWANSREVVEAIERVDAAYRSIGEERSGWERARRELTQSLEKVSQGAQNFRYAVWNREYRLIADVDDASPVLGNLATPFSSSLLSRVLHGEPILWLPTNEGYITSGFKVPATRAKAGISMLIPVYAEARKDPIATIMIAGLGMQDRFETVFASARIGASGETYAIDKNGYFITESRFTEQLVGARLLEKSGAGHNIQSIRVANPGGNINAGFIPDLNMRSVWPLTKAAGLCISREVGFDLDGYSDYRGVEVVGGWCWLDRYGFGIITEVDVDDAFSALRPVRWAFRGLIGLMGLLTFALIAHAGLSIRARRGKTMADAIGPYNIIRRIGEGGLAQVFLARHSLLSRDTALKILKPDRVNAQNMSRFQREVQLACRLTHPNSIAIFDYGKTEDGSFYYVMEYIAGYTLQQVIDLDGAQHPARVAKIMYQVCRSLREAHEKGMVHRDIKLQNVMICELGGECDRVKVLDFGLVKELSGESHFATDTRVLVGTPLYIAPERIADPSCTDPRSDIFSLGVLAQILITGKEPHQSGSSVEAMYHSLKSEPVYPSTMTEQFIPKELDQLIHDCQLRDARLRPQSALAIMEILLSTGIFDQWTEKDARRWWSRYPRPEKLTRDDF